MRNRCGLNNCNNVIHPKAPGAEVGYMINNLIHRVVVCNDCAWKLMVAPRGTWMIDRHKRLVPVPASPIIIT